MIKPRYNPFLSWFFSKYTIFSIQWHFSKVNIQGEFNDTGKPVLMIGNHFSWWDGFFAHYLNMKLLHRRFNVMMLERELKKRMFLNKIGAFSLSRGAHEMLRSLEFLKELMKDNQNLVVYYPQGKFQSIYDSPIKFQRGIEHVLKGFSSQDIQVFLYAGLVDYLKHKKPALTFYIGEYSLEKGGSLQDIEDAYNALYQQGMKNQIEAV
jgi:hypothetical protein